MFFLTLSNIDGIMYASSEKQCGTRQADTCVVPAQKQVSAWFHRAERPVSETKSSCTAELPAQKQVSACLVP